MKLATIPVIWCLTTSALAADCPPAPDHSAALAGLLVQVQTAPNETAARQISNQMWELWTDAPDELAQEMLDTGIRARESYDFVGALGALDQLTDYCPAYAEGYNQRAFVNFLRQDFAAALPDLDRALELSPEHVGALSGKALTLIGLGRDDEAQATLRVALALNPWLSERSLLKEPPGTDL